MNIYLDNPLTERDRVILITIRANPNVCTVPLKVKRTENSLSLNMKKRNATIMTKPIQYLVSLF